jgi:rhodanese-related sulfurtransferase
MPTEIDREEVRTMAVSGAQLLDVLPVKAYEEERLPGAINIPLSRLDSEADLTLDRNRPVIVYCYDYQCDLSARAAWRLETLGFTKVFRYTPGKADWFANGLPREGRQAGVPHAGELARRDAPTCHLNDRAGDVYDRIRSSGWDMCVVINGRRVTLGALSLKAMTSDPNAAAEQLMEPGPATIRPSWTFEKTSEFLKEKNLERILVTTSEGVLYGVYFQAEAARRMENFRASEQGSRGDQIAEASKAARKR